ncbi:MAG: hypothetical protein U0694_16140 [Anaerolineae bacterium]
MLSESRGIAEMAPWLMIYPALAIMFGVLGFNLLGDGLRDMLDPRLRGHKGNSRRPRLVVHSHHLASLRFLD